MKTPRAFGLAAALIAALLVAPASAMAQGRAPSGEAKASAKPAKAPKAGEIPAAARKAGNEQAPALVQAIGLPCQISDARMIGEDKKAKISIYEVACAPGTMGYVLQAQAGGATTAFSCIEANTPLTPDKPPSAPCMLPGNANPEALLGPMLQTAKVSCAPEKVRGIGQTKTATYVEVACQGGAGYVVVASSPFDVTKPVTAQSCLIYDEGDTNIKCTIVDKSVRLAVIDRYVTQAANGCAVKDKRFVGVSKDGNTYYEASCQDGKGYVYQVTTAGALGQTIECAKASSIMGGCQLTDARQAQSEQAALYTRLAKSAGSSCEVEKYALFPPKPGEENVELVCKDGSGAIGIFKAAGGSQVLNCGHALAAGFKCSLGGAASGNAALTSDLKKFDYNSCAVSNTRVVGKNDTGNIFVEVACADGLKGYVIEYKTQPTVSAVKAVACAFSGNCKLPGNV